MSYNGLVWFQTPVLIKIHKKHLQHSSSIYLLKSSLLQISRTMSPQESRYNIAPPRATSTPQQHNDSSVFILLPPVRKRVTSTRIFTELKKKNGQIPKSLYIKNLFIKCFEENVCLFTKHRFLKEVKCENCNGCDNDVVTLLRFSWSCMLNWKGCRMDQDFLEADNSKNRHSNDKNFIETQVIWTFLLRKVESVVLLDLVLQIAKLTKIKRLIHFFFKINWRFVLY